MRALIRIDLEPKKKYIDLWNEQSSKDDKNNDNVRLFSWDNIPGNDSERLLNFLPFLGYKWAHKVQNDNIKKAPIGAI